MCPTVRSPTRTAAAGPGAGDDELPELAREAAALAGPDHPDHTRYLSGLATALRLRAIRLDDNDALDEAIAVGRRCVAATPAGHPSLVDNAGTLAAALEARFDRTGDPDDLAAARAAYAQATTSAGASRLAALVAHWGEGRTAATAGDVTALSAFEAAVDLLPRLAPRQLARTDREYGLGRASGLAGQAAAAAVLAGRPDRALELLEQTRGVLIAGDLDARGERAELRRRHPGPAAALDRIAAAIDVLDGASGTPAELAERRRQQHRTWDDTVEAIRELPGFEHFLRPAPAGDLLREAADGPIVIVYTSPWRCDALVLRPGAHRPDVVPLPSLTEPGLRHLVGRFLAGRAAAQDATTTQERHAGHQAVQAVVERLWDDIAEPVLDALGISGPPPVGQAWPRLWWCPTGIIALLPLHAAGHHRDPGDRTVLDRVVSSVIATVRVLHEARERAPIGDTAVPDPLIVCMPRTPGAAPLRGVARESDRLAALVPAARTITGHAATVQAITTELPGRRVAHFACHGVSRWDDPAASSLLLHDGPLTVASVSRLRLRDAELAFLSACSTSDAGAMVPDEAIHLISAFQVAGYRQVIGTLWAVNDPVATRITAEVYARLACGGPAVQTADAALALHHAVRTMRSAMPSAPAAWAAHVHAGC